MYEHFVSKYNLIFPFDDDLEVSLKRFITSGGHAVDLGCGTGRLVHLVHRLGMNASGVDLDLAMIEKAKMDYPHLSFYHESMVDYLDRDVAYDLILCFGNTLPHVNQHDLFVFFSRIKKRLNQSGFVLIQLLNYDKILKDKPSVLKPIIFDGGRFIRTYTYHHDTITFKTVLEMDSLRSEGSTTLYPYRREDLSKIIGQAGLQYRFVSDLDQAYDNLDLDHITLIITH